MEPDFVNSSDRIIDGYLFVQKILESELKTTRRITSDRANFYSIIISLISEILERRFFFKSIYEEKNSESYEKRIVLSSRILERKIREKGVVNITSSELLEFINILIVLNNLLISYERMFSFNKMVEGTNDSYKDSKINSSKIKEIRNNIVFEFEKTKEQFLEIASSLKKSKFYYDKIKRAYDDIFGADGLDKTNIGLIAKFESFFSETKIKIGEFQDNFDNFLESSKCSRDEIISEIKGYLPNGVTIGLASAYKEKKRT